MELLVLWALLGGAVGALIAGSKGGSTGNGCVVGAFLGPVGWVLTALTSGPSTTPCPYCREPLRRGAVLCPHCRQGLAEPDATAGGVLAAAAADRTNLARPIVLVVALIAGLIIWQLASSSRPGSAPAAAPASPGSAAALLRADQVIIPPEQFPVSGVVVRQDQAGTSRGAWTRVFGPPDRDDVLIGVNVIPVDGAVIDPRGFLEIAARSVCAVKPGSAATTALDTGAVSPAVGDADRACVIGYASGPASLLYYSVVGRYLVEVAATGTVGATAADRIGIAQSVVRVQAAIIRRLTQ